MLAPVAVLGNVFTDDIIAVATLVTALAGFVSALRAGSHAKRADRKSDQAVDLAKGNRDLLAAHLRRVEGAYGRFAQRDEALLEFLTGERRRSESEARGRGRADR